MDDTELEPKVVSWTKFFTDDVDSKVAGLQFTSEQLAGCRNRHRSYISLPVIMTILGGLLFCFVLASASNQIDEEIFEINDGLLYKLVDFASGMIRGRKDVD